jgi:hypothetical protein
LLAFSIKVIYKLLRATRGHHELKILKCLIRRFPMKKLLCVVSVLMMSLVVVGCGNSPDGDKQKIEAPAAPSL